MSSDDNAKDSTNTEDPEEGDNKKHDRITSRAEIWVEVIEDREESIRSFLREVRKTQLHDGKKAREMLRQFANKERNRAFAAIYFGYEGTEAFFEDIREAGGEKAVEKLESLVDDFEDLANEFEIVYRETYQSYMSPVTDFESEIEYTTGPEGDPMITFRTYSGSMETMRTRVPPNELLGLGANVLAAILRPPEMRNEELNLTDKELEDLKDEYEHARGHLDEVDELIEKQDSDNNSNDES